MSRDLKHLSPVVIAAGPGRRTAADESQAVLHGRSDASFYQWWPWSRCLCRALARMLPVACVSLSESSMCLEEHGTAKQKKRSTASPLLPSRLEAGRGIPSTAQHLRSFLGSSSPLIIIPPDHTRTQRQRPPSDQHVADESKGEDKPHTPIPPVSWRKRNATSQSLPHDLSSPSGPGSLMGCDTGSGLQERGLWFLRMLRTGGDTA